MKQAQALAVAFALSAATLSASSYADGGWKGIPHLDRVFVIMMENHGFSQIYKNPNEPYLNGLISSGKVSYATNYFAVGHPSLTNYLEIVGGSNFGVLSDKYPNWHNKSCTPYLTSGHPILDNDAGIALPFPNDTYVCPISGTGSDAATVAVDTFNEVDCNTATPPVCSNVLANLDGVRSIPQAKHITGMSIAHQLVHFGQTWKSYQESLPQSGADLIDYSNGTASLVFDTATAATSIQPVLTPSTPDVVALYAVKHNPFAYFADIQGGWNPELSLTQTVGFDQLFADLATGNVPTLSFIAPNQCNDQHGRGNGEAFCAFDPSDTGSQSGLNAGLIAQGDVMIERLVKAIKASPAWHQGTAAMVIVWDENDYSGVPKAPPVGTPFPPANQNSVVVTVETNYRQSPNVASKVYYTHFSLLRTLEAGLGLPCLNHACDPDVHLMTDMFGY